MAKNEVTNNIESKKINNFWLMAGLLVILLATSMSRDIFRPFYGLHSWAEAHSAWDARVQVKYGLGYTKGFECRAVGNPPVENPYRYLDHPQLYGLLNAPAMAILGINTWSLRVTNIVATILTLLLFLRILRGLLDDETALLGGLFFCLFPVIGYFGVNMWLYPFCFWAIWNYLVVINALQSGPEPQRKHKIYLAISLFMALQLSWEGFFFALAIGIHYVCRCIYRRQFPDKALLAILTVAPLSSLAIDFIIMAGGHGWDFQKIINLYNWRAGSGELEEHVWSKWFATLWKHARTNFTLPILIIAIVQLTIGQFFVITHPKSQKNNTRTKGLFPFFLLFFMIPFFQMVLLKGCLWRHQTWERPFMPLLAIAAAQGIVLLEDLLKKANKKLAITCTAVLVTIILIASIKGTNYYYGIRWQSPTKTQMFENLQKNIPPDKALLSFEPFTVNQNSAKGVFYRPEIAWYLDRDIVQATTFAEIQNYAKTNRYPYYLIPVVDQLKPLLAQLQQQYKFEYVQGDPGEEKYGKFYRAGTMNYMIFDLHSKIE